jgi:hypothetical protein
MADHEPRMLLKTIRALTRPRGFESHALHLISTHGLPDLDPRAAAEAFRVIACDASVDDGLRSSAAEQLARLDPRAGPPGRQRNPRAVSCGTSHLGRSFPLIA